MKITFYTDYHIGAPNELKNAPPIPERYSTDVYFLGDMYDLANCKKSDVPMYNEIVRLMKKVWKRRWLDGNHERQRNTDIFVPITDGVGCMHGDFISWGYNKAKEYRAGKHGAGLLKRTFWVNALEIAELGLERKLNTQDLMRADEMLVKCSKIHGKNFKVIIMGHMHTAGTYDTPGGNKVVVLERGKTTLDLGVLGV